MIKLANVKIGKKMGLMIGASALQVVCLTGVALWSVHTLNLGLDATRDEGRRGALALRISSHSNAIGVNFAAALAAKEFDADTLSRIAALRDERLAYFNELAALSNSDEDKHLRENILQTALQWKGANSNLIRAVKKPSGTRR
jgi:hypothetical protein